jgi:hypothetical protein
MKFLHFFLFLWVIYALLDPDPADQNQCGSGSNTVDTAVAYLKAVPMTWFPGPAADGCDQFPGIEYVFFIFSRLIGYADTGI